MRTEFTSALAALALMAGSAASAQRANRVFDDDVPPAPRLDPADDERAAATPAARTSLERPNAARLAPLPEGVVEEIVVVADPALRLPDLGTSLRLEREAREAREGRIRVTYLPPLQPIDPLTSPLLLRVDPEARRVGYIEIFRINFGRPRE